MEPNFQGLTSTADPTAEFKAAPPPAVPNAPASPPGSGSHGALQARLRPRWLQIPGLEGWLGLKLWVIIRRDSMRLVAAWTVS